MTSDDKTRKADFGLDRAFAYTMDTGRVTTHPTRGTLQMNVKHQTMPSENCRRLWTSCALDNVWNKQTLKVDQTSGLPHAIKDWTAVDILLGGRTDGRSC